MNCLRFLSSLLLVLSLAPFAAGATGDDSWAAFRFLMGEWGGDRLDKPVADDAPGRVLYRVSPKTVQGFGRLGKGGFSVALDLKDKVLAVRSSTSYSSKTKG